MSSSPNCGLSPPELKKMFRKLKRYKIDINQRCRDTREIYQIRVGKLRALRQACVGSSTVSVTLHVLVKKLTRTTVTSEWS